MSEIIATEADFWRVYNEYNERKAAEERAAAADQVARSQDPRKAPPIELDAYDLTKSALNRSGMSDGEMYEYLGRNRSQALPQEQLDRERELLQATADAEAARKYDAQPERLDEEVERRLIDHEQRQRKLPVLREMAMERGLAAADVENLSYDDLDGFLQPKPEQEPMKPEEVQAYADELAGETLTQLLDSGLQPSTIRADFSEYSDSDFNEAVENYKAEKASKAANR